MCIRDRFAVISVLVYIGGLMCSHLAAFRIATNMRIAMTKHIATLPLGKIEQFGSGRLRRTISETSGAAEAYLAHQLPDKYRAIATTVGLLALLAVFDWRLGLISLVPVVLGFACMTKMTGKSMQEKMTEYQNALADMSNEAVEYVRGIPVVKTFGQTVFSFKKFKAAIDNYEKWTIAYTKEMRGPMTLYTLAINSVFIFLIAGGYWPVSYTHLVITLSKNSNGDYIVKGEKAGTANVKYFVKKEAYTLYSEGAGKTEYVKPSDVKSSPIIHITVTEGKMCIRDRS